MAFRVLLGGWQGRPSRMEPMKCDGRRRAKVRLNELPVRERKEIQEMLPALCRPDDFADLLPTARLLGHAFVS